MRAVVVQRPGMLTTIQDLGRWGFQARGVPVGGAMDAASLRLSNRLVGNDEAAAALEATLIGPELLFEAPAVVAVAGGDLAPALDGQAMPMHTAFDVRSGQVLRFGTRRTGARAYIAIDGGIDVPVVLGSRATHLVSRMGGLDGRALRRGDRLALGAPAPDRARVAGAGIFELPVGEAIVRVLPGPHESRLTASAQETLYGSSFTLASASNRMGYRLDGPPLGHTAGADIISEAVPIGAIQVPASGQPILMMADRQTSGGYPTVAVVISADLRIAGQLAPGDRIRFARCDSRAARAALVEQERRLRAVC